MVSSPHRTRAQYPMKATPSSLTQSQYHFDKENISVPSHTSGGRGYGGNLAPGDQAGVKPERAIAPLVGVFLSVLTLAGGVRGPMRMISGYRS